MDKGFAKQLTERERIHHTDHYHHYRHVKGPKGAWGDNEVGGREGMRIRYNHGYDRKSFNENLNPLKSWLHSGLGKNWDKYYGELRKQFDARNVINAHILEHLFQYVEIQTHVGEKGAVMFMNTRYSSMGEQPISKCHKDYYVCPKSGMLRKTQKQPRRSVIKQKEAERRAARDAIFRQLDRHNVLHLIDGAWYHFELKPIPTAKVTYVKPEGREMFKTGRLFALVEKPWDELNQSERERHGKVQIVGTTARDMFTNAVVYRDQNGIVHHKNSCGQPLFPGYLKQELGLYHATKATASHKQLKQAGLAA